MQPMHPPPYHCVPERAWSAVASTAGASTAGARWGKKKAWGEKRVINSPRLEGLRTGIHNHYQLYPILCRFVNPNTLCCGEWCNGERKSCGVWGRVEMNHMAHASTPHDGEPSNC
jgi:hypothetical protein